ncbi:MAG: alpha/beta hydrolase [Alphaproteobacteria bacterium]|nr:alpha/beta hydrolase [Alphaproteobacteria bacterium]
MIAALSQPDTSELETPLARFEGAEPAAPRWFAEAVACRPEEKVISVEGTPIHYLRWGDRARPGLLLVHGNAAHAHWWSFIAPFLSRDYNIAALDLSGMGDSGWRESYTMELFAREELAVCDDAGMFALAEPPIIVGHSFGGFVTLLTGALYGERLKGTVIVDSPVTPPERKREKSPLRAHARNVYPTLAAALARFRLLPPQVCENLFLLDWVARRSLRPVDGGYVWKFDPAIWHDFSIGDTAARLKATRCRIALFRGEQSILMPAEIGEYMFNLLGRAAPVVDIPQAQHHLMLDQPLAFVAALRALLADWDHSQPRRRAL